MSTILGGAGDVAAVANERVGEKVGDERSFNLLLQIEKEIISK